MLNEQKESHTLMWCWDYIPIGERIWNVRWMCLGTFTFLKISLEPSISRVRHWEEFRKGLMNMSIRLLFCIQQKLNSACIFLCWLVTSTSYIAANKSLEQLAHCCIYMFCMVLDLIHCHQHFAGDMLTLLCDSLSLLHFFCWLSGINNSDEWPNWNLALCWIWLVVWVQAEANVRTCATLSSYLQGPKTNVKKKHRTTTTFLWVFCVSFS